MCIVSLWIEKSARYTENINLVVENNAGKVIFVPGLGCDVEHYSQNQQFYFKMNGLD